MSTPLWDLFVQRVTALRGRPIPGEMDRLAEEFATRLVAMNTPDAADALSSFTEMVAERYERIRSLDREAPPGVPKPIPTPPEIIAEVLREFDEAEVLESIREMESGSGRQLKDFLPELRQAGGLPPA